MCCEDDSLHLSAEEEIAAEESLSIYCKPVELYNILQRRALRNVNALSGLTFPCLSFYFMVIGSISSGLNQHIIIITVDFIVSK